MNEKNETKPSNFETEWNKRFNECENEYEAFLLTCGATLGLLNGAAGERFDPRTEHPTTWPALLAKAMLRISAMRRKTPQLRAWLQGATETMAAMREHGISVPN